MNTANFSPDRLWIGLDVGGTKIEGVAVDGTGALRGRVLEPTDPSSADQAVNSIIRALEAVLRAADVPVEQAARAVAGVGIGIPGKVEDGVVSLAVNLKLTACPLAAVLTERFGVPVALENDVRAATLGAYAWVREQRPVTGMVYLSIGTGIAAGVILDGRLHRGAGGMAGEVGHAILEPGGELCKCGMRGCFETTAAGPAIVRRAQAAVRAARELGAATTLSGPDPLTAEQVFAAARAGDALACAVIDRVGFFTSRAVYNLFLNYDVPVVALGGGISHAGAVFFDPVCAHLARMAGESPLACEMLGGPSGAEKVLLVPRAADAAWRGMILLAQQQAGQV